MKKLVLIFDYFKEAFHINKQNKALYKPQIALIAVNVLLVLFVGIGAYTWINVENINNLSQMSSSEILSFALGQGLKVLTILLAYGILSVIVESGLLNMYKKAVTQGYTEAGDFREGLSKYFFKLLIGEILIIICYILAFPFYLIIGLVSLTVGLTVIPIVAGVFLTMWKVSLVMNDSGLFAAVGDSFSFAKKNFIPLTVLQIINWSFTKGSGGGGNANFNFPDTSNFGNEFGNGVQSTPGLEEVIRIIKIVIAVLIPIITIATISASIIAMIFQVFFSLALFVAYKNGFHVKEEQVAVEELHPKDSIQQSEEVNEKSIDSQENTEIIDTDDAAETVEGASNEEEEQ